MKRMKRIVITGSRSWTDAKTIARVLKQFCHPREIIHGGALGADQMAGVIAEELGFRVVAMRADWEKHGRAAGVIRNRAMLEMHPEVVIAFWDGKSRGTKNTIDEAKKRGIPVLIVGP